MTVMASAPEFPSTTRRCASLSWSSAGGFPKTTIGSVASGSHSETDANCRSGPTIGSAIRRNAATLVEAGVGAAAAIAATASDCRTLLPAPESVPPACWSCSRRSRCSVLSFELPREGRQDAGHDEDPGDDPRDRRVDPPGAACAGWRGHPPSTAPYPPLCVRAMRNSRPTARVSPWGSLLQVQPGSRRHRALRPIAFWPSSRNRWSASTSWADGVRGTGRLGCGYGPVLLRCGRLTVQSMSTRAPTTRATAIAVPITIAIRRADMSES